MKALKQLAKNVASGRARRDFADAAPGLRARESDPALRPILPLLLRLE
jgi:hypothetical protein